MKPTGFFIVFAVVMLFLLFFGIAEEDYDVRVRRGRGRNVGITLYLA